MWFKVINYLKIEIYLVLLRSKRFKILDQATLKRGYNLLLCILDSLIIDSMVSTKRFMLLIGGI